MTNPLHPGRPQWVARKIARRARRSRWSKVGFTGGLASGVAGGTGALVLQIPDLAMPALMATICALPCLVAAVWQDAHINILRDEYPKTGLTKVPRGTAIAYEALITTPARLRVLGATEAATATIEGQIGYAEELLVESARLLSADAMGTPEGTAVEDAMFTLSAHASALVAVAIERETAIVAASLATGLLLDRAPDLTEFERAADEMADETAFVVEVLNGLGLPPAPVT